MQRNFHPNKHNNQNIYSNVHRLLFEYLIFVPTIEHHIQQRTCSVCTASSAVLWLHIGRVAFGPRLRSPVTARLSWPSPRSHTAASPVRGSLRGGELVTQGPHSQEPDLQQHRDGTGSCFSRNRMGIKSQTDQVIVLTRLLFISMFFLFPSLIHWNRAQGGSIRWGDAPVEKYRCWFFIQIILHNLLHPLNSSTVLG